MEHLLETTVDTTKLWLPVPPQVQPHPCAVLSPPLLGLCYKVENEARFSALENHNILTEEPN